MCEAAERNQQALHAIKAMTGTWTIDLGLLKQILTGPCTNHEGDNNEHLPELP